MFNFHGFGSNAVQQMTYADFKPQADKYDFLIVAPDGQGSAGGRHFSFGNEKGLQNDITMVQSLLSRMEATLCVDATRVYSTGMSDGGAMTSLLACLAPKKFAAFAAVAVIIYCGKKNGPPVALASFQGTADPVVPYNGGAVHCCGGAVLGSKPAAMASWAAHDHCATKPIECEPREPGGAADLDRLREGQRGRLLHHQGRRSHVAGSRSRSRRSASRRNRSRRAT